MSDARSTVTDAQTEAATSFEETSAPAKPRWGVAAMLLLVLVGGVVLHTTGVVTIEPEAIVIWLRGAGIWGAALLIVLFALGTLANVPGLVFIAASVTLYGPVGGYAVSLVGAVAAVNLSFLLGRATGLGNSSVLDKPMLKRITKMLHERPILTLTILRAVVLVSPPVNYALALTRLRHRDYALGSALGLVVPLMVVTATLSCVIS